jgi:hypothetical protein
MKMRGRVIYDNEGKSLYGLATSEKRGQSLDTPLGVCEGKIRYKRSSIWQARTWPVWATCAVFVVMSVTGSGIVIA